MPQIRSVHAVLLFGILFCQSTVLAQDRPGTLRGSVSSVDGGPAIDIPVAAFELPDSRGLFANNAIATGTTDEQGQYILSRLPAGRYKVLPNVRSIADVIPRALDEAPEIVVRAGRETVHDMTLRSPQGVTVSGRVNGDPLMDELQTVSLETETSFLRTNLAFDGTFSFQDVAPGTYRLSLSETQFVWGPDEIQVENQDVRRLELTPDESIPVKGRAITEGSGPVPRLMFSLDGAKGATRTGRIWVMDSLRSSGMVAVSGWSDKPDDVIFTASLPIGDYRIRLVNLPPGYRVKSFTYGATDLLEDPLSLTGEIQQLSIVLSAPEPSSRVNVRGRVILDQTLPWQFPMDRIVLKSNALLTPLEAPVLKNGSFEISGVPPGIYDVTEPLPGLKLSVGDRDMRGVEIRASRVVPLWGRNVPTPADGSPVSTAKPVMRVLRGRIDVEGRMNSAPYLTLKPVTGSRDIPTISLSDDTFSGSVAEGEYKVAVGNLDERYQIQSLTYGLADLRNEPLHIAGDSDGLLLMTARLKTQKRLTVSGHISADPAERDSLRVFLQGISGQFTVQPDSDGRFTFHDLFTGRYEIFAGTGSYPEETYRKILALSEDDIDGIVLLAPQKKRTRTLEGRIVVNGGYPMPSVSLTVRPDVDSGSSLADPFTLRSGPGGIYGGFVIGPDGRFAIELPEGNHRLRVHGYPNYTVKSLRYGSADLRKELLRIRDGNLQELVITFDAAPRVPWRKVKGRVDGFGNIAEPVKVILESTRTKHRLEMAPRRDGSFEFPKVPPDTYTIWFAPRVAMTSARTLVVADRDVEDVNLRIPTQRTVNLQITATSGALPSNMNLVLTANSNEQYTILLNIGFVLRTANEMVCISDACSFPMVRSLGEPAVISASPRDGKYVLKLPEGEYRIGLQRFPTDYQLQSFTHGTVDLREQPLRVGPEPTQEIVAQLRYH